MTVDLAPAQNPTGFNSDGFRPDQLEHLKELVVDDDFQDADSLQMSVSFACRALRPAKGPYRFTSNEIGGFLGISASTVNHQCRGGTSAPRGPGRPSVLTDVIREWIYATTRKRFDEQDPIIHIELLDTVQQSFKMSVKLDTPYHIIARMPDIKSVAGVPSEANRAEVDPQVIQDWLTMLETEIQGIPRGFVLSMDEPRCSDSADRPRELAMIVTTSSEDDTVLVPFDCKSKPAAMAVYIAADRWRIKPFVVVYRATFEREFIYY
jgi:hypothetical protein